MNKGIYFAFSCDFLSAELYEKKKITRSKRRYCSLFISLVYMYSILQNFIFDKTKKGRINKVKMSDVKILKYQRKNSDQVLQYMHLITFQFTTHWVHRIKGDWLCCSRKFSNLSLLTLPRTLLEMGNFLYRNQCPTCSPKTQWKT